MLYETGIVSAVNGVNATVQTQNQLACSSCKVVDTCGNGIIEKYFSGKVFSSDVKNDLNAKVGDKVTLAIPKSSVTKASIIVYLVPLLIFILAAAGISFYTQNENIVILVSLCGLASGLFATKFYNRKLLKSELYLPKIVSILDNRLSELERTQKLKSDSVIDIQS